ncbi:adenine phosphoribosyltransferase [Brachybacterium hainanense]|uniref:Adenine phosphoribosyltransferase n=1 Tax=Brachybacterium hainanense TaxID=1541174 RepID=A0ABV6REI6_9MICO
MSIQTLAPEALDALMSSHIAEYPDFPEPGILFRDITPLLRDADALRTVIRHWASVVPADVEVIIGTEARGFVLGAPLAYELGVGFVPVRKAGKLPGTPRSRTYDLEYGTATIEIAEGALAPGVRTLVVDDLLATGGTAAATVALARELGADVLGAHFLIELSGLAGRERLGDLPVTALWSIDDEASPAS